MPTETIWSSGHSSPIQASRPLESPSATSNATNASNTKGFSQFKSVLDQVDPDVASLLANSNPFEGLPSSTGLSERRLSFNDGSDIDDTFFGFKRGALSAITAPVGGHINYNSHPSHFNFSKNANGHEASGGDNNGGQRLNFGTASISGGIASRHPPQESFLQRFSNVADATREIEFGNLSLGTTLQSPNNLSTSMLVGDSGTKGGSLNENLNMPAPRGSRHQSISEKIDNYNNNSPIQSNAALSVHSDLNATSDVKIGNGATGGTHLPQSFWNPASAASFTPANYQSYFMENNAGFAVPTPPPPPPFPPHHAPQNFYRQNQGHAQGQGPIPPMNGPPPPFMVASPPLPQFLDPGLYNMMYGNFFPFPHPPPSVPAEGDDIKEGSGSGSGSGSLSGSPKPNKSGDAETKDSRDNNAHHAGGSETEKGTNENDKRNEHQNGNGPIGVGLMNRQFLPSSFMFHPFNPYPMYQQGLQGPMMSPDAMRSMSPQPMGGMPLPPSAHNSSPRAAVAPVEKPSSARKEAANGANTGNGGNSGNNGNNGNGGNGGNGVSSAAAKKKTQSSSSASSSSKGTKSGGSAHIHRSPLLEEVRSNPKGKEYTLRDIYGHAVEFTKDQHGSRFIQQKLPTASAEEKEVIFNEIRDISYELMTDVFGNYVIQKFFEHGSRTQKRILLGHMVGSIYELSLQMYGCRVVQRALESLEDVEDQLKITQELRDYILICSKDQNGNHVIQKSIEKIKPFDKIRFILTSLEDQIYHLSTHSYGCRVIQRLLEYSNKQDQKLIMSELNKFIYYLIQDQYGNYVIQHILEQGEPEEKEEILTIVLGNVVSFSKHKFASNVIEKCIKYGDLKQRQMILHEVMLGNEDNNNNSSNGEKEGGEDKEKEKGGVGKEDSIVADDSPLALMMKDQYANYVIQKLVEAFDSNSSEKKQLVLKLRQYLKQLSDKSNYGGKHLASVEKMIIVAETALD
ncbi:uncharacterized protein LODBEIA_P52590 [Lodderomyces beijingensis]|uniref:PUM-HD domain-containing protein n=1 Tax=Lodderomyces beijingensis TaxID=1775926 RepID=A0ABP0ZSC5_9ASCO